MTFTGFPRTLCNIPFSYLAEQTPGVVTQVWADGGQQQGLPLDELKHQVLVHALDGELPVLIFGRLRAETV